MFENILISFKSESLNITNILNEFPWDLILIEKIENNLLSSSFTHLLSFILLDPLSLIVSNWAQYVSYRLIAYSKKECNYIVISFNFMLLLLFIFIIYFKLIVWTFIPTFRYIHIVRSLKYSSELCCLFSI